ncbi:MAG TPA: glucose-6-phosphate isomerase [Bdellovibrionota bacterium]|jgi:glucose-6-phosphate isomerase
MRESLRLESFSIPGYNANELRERGERLLPQLAEWSKSDFAGFRRVLDSGSDCYPDLKKIRRMAAAHRKGSSGKPIRDFVILGIGGSSLGAEAILRALHSPLQEPRFHVLDNADPAQMSWLLKGLDSRETLFYVVAKSGATPETLSQFLVAIQWVKKRAKGESWKKHFVLCTDPAKGDLRTLASRWKLDCLEVPPAVGGRFSVLTPVGLFPAAFAGIPLDPFLKGAASVAAWEKAPWHENPCAQLALALAKNARERPITVLMPYSSRLSAFSRWFCQLWAESLGKKGRGLTPYPATGATDQHSQMQLYMEGPADKCLLFVHVANPGGAVAIPSVAGTADLPSFGLLKGKSVGGLLEAEFRATRDAVTNQGIPNGTLAIDKLDAYSLGALFYFWEWATAIAGAELGVNPFDQPGVEAAKVLTKKYLNENR